MSIINLFLIPVGIAALLAFVIAAIYAFIIYPIRTKRFRKNPKLYSHCKFYINDEEDSKYLGKIVDYKFPQARVEFLNKWGDVDFKVIHISNIFPQW